MSKPFQSLAFIFRALPLLLLAVPAAQAQTKIFKEVAHDMSSQFELIYQDGNLVGYLYFTQLEKASADSFNYKLSIMDENLNDIGTVNFREENLTLKAVSFESDVLCLAYVKSNFVGIEYKSIRQFHHELDNARSELFTQFVSLNGRILGKYSVKMDIKPDYGHIGTNVSRRVMGNGKLKQQIQLRNIPGKGFACFYGDDSKNSLIVFNSTGKLAWQRTIKEDATGFVMLTSGSEIDLLLKKKEKMLEGGYEIISYNTRDSSAYPKFLLKDRKGNSLKVMTFDNDPVSGKPFVSGLVIDPVKGNNFLKGRSVVRGAYCGLFSIGLNGHRREDIKPSFSYWADGSQGATVDKHGYYEAAAGYPNIETSFRDYQGNTWFAGSGVHRHFRWGGYIAGVITLPLILPPIFLMVPGTHSYSSGNVMLVKQDGKGSLSLENTIPVMKLGPANASAPLSEFAERSFYTVANSDTKNNYLIIDDMKNIQIYDVNQKKIARKIPHDDGNSKIFVFPAKEGHVMISEYNYKQKQTRLSIEAL